MVAIHDHGAAQCECREKGAIRATQPPPDGPASSAPATRRRARRERRRLTEQPGGQTRLFSHAPLESGPLGSASKKSADPKRKSQYQTRGGVLTSQTRWRTGSIRPLVRPRIKSAVARARAPTVVKVPISDPNGPLCATGRHRAVEEKSHGSDVVQPRRLPDSQSSVGAQRPEYDVLRSGVRPSTRNASATGTPWPTASTLGDPCRHSPGSK